MIAVLPWEEWWEFEQTKDDANPHIALLPLHPDYRARFNVTAAWEYARSMDGKPYGYHNLIFSWIDTISGNYPPPLDAHLVGFAHLLSFSFVSFFVLSLNKTFVEVNDCLALYLLCFCLICLQVASVMTVWSKIQPDYAANMWNEALNKRLGTEVLASTPHSSLLSSYRFI